MTRALLALALLASGCARTSGAESPSVDGSAVVEATTSTTPAATTAPRTPAATAVWRGSYTSAPGTMYVPPTWKNLQWKGAETSAGIGEGAMTLAIDPASGRVAGTLEGPLGPATVDGLAGDGKVTASVRRRDPGDHGFTGTLVGSVASAHATGNMNLSLAEASAIRTATFELAPGGPDTTPAAPGSAP
jgi:hypothetical protein